MMPVGVGMATILLVEDDPNIRRLMALTLALDHDLLEAADIEAAWQAIAQRRPDLIISDVAMPGGSGFDLVQRLRADPNLVTVPVLLVTAHSEATSIRTALHLGVEGYFTKPFSPAELLRRVAEALAR
jgi:DNA-binding response OmpR family regulator